MTNEKELKLTNIEKMEIIGALNNDISFMRHIGMNYKKPEAYERRKKIIEDLVDKIDRSIDNEEYFNELRESTYD